MLRCIAARPNWIKKNIPKCWNRTLQLDGNFSTHTLTKTWNYSEKKYNPGSIYHGFLCTDVQEIQEFNMKAISFKHEKSKTEYLHIQRDDPNNLFSINFRTTPFNSTGLPHILEHTVLCGSKKYPIRDPFFKMLNRSLATFMNAMTGPDYTLYPFSSQNETDYRNLQAIYLDAVFRPNLNHLDFLQEGWRLENSDLNDPNSDLVFKGVVFNEMKGVFSENSALFAQKFLNTILPDHTYGFVSGGDPLQIPNLTVQDLRNFHKKYYHPSNARIFSYGNFPVERNLQICNSLYLNDCDGIDSTYSRVPPQSRWEKPMEQNLKCRFDKMGAPIENQNQLAVGYLMSDIANVYETFELQFLSELMVLGPNSAFYKALIEPNISGGYNSTTGYDPQMKDTMFAVGLQDLSIDKFESVKEIMDSTINSVIKDGFTKSHIDSVLHGIELNIKHQTTRFGLNLLFNLTPLWNHEGDVIEAMKVGKCLDKFKENLKNPTYLQERVKHYFQSNNHKLILTMTPDESYEENIIKKEDELLKTTISRLSEDDKQNIYKQGLQLAEAQKVHQNINILPCLSLNDISKDVKKNDIDRFKINQAVPVQMCKANTNGVTYFKGILNMHNIPNDLKLLMPLFNATISKMDTKNYSYRDFDQFINLRTAGLGVSTHVSTIANNPIKYDQGVMLSSHCLNHNLQHMLTIWCELFNKPIFKDTDRFKMLLDNYVSSLTTGIADSGHLYAMQSANSLLLGSSLLKENLSGMRHIDFIKNTLKTESTEAIMQKISTISDLLLHRDRLRIAVNLSNSNYSDAVSRFDRFASVLPLGNKGSPSYDLTEETCFQRSIKGLHYKNNFSVNYCAKSILTVPYIHKDFAKLKVLAKFLSSKYLHPTVREQNGAYGGGARLTDDGIFGFFSYRDPNSSITLDVFDNSNAWLKDCPKDVFDDQAIFESKLGILQQLDAPVAEFNKGIDEFLSGISAEMKQNHKNAVLSVTKDDMIYACEKYLSNGQQNRAIGKCVIGPGETNESNKTFEKEGENWEVILPNKE